ncbi:MAG: MATE family efflux transporter [Clostridia bacterium]|nr:MATE family efflux transporter [Clostridia bacterium]
MDSEIFEKLSPTKLFFRLAIPSMITMAFGALYQIADGLFVGRFIGGDALAAVNLIMPIIMIVFGFANLIATGASVRISILLGEKNREEASKVFTYTLKVIFLISCVLGVLGLAFAETFVRFLAPGATELAIQYGITYTRIYAAFAPLMLIYHATDNYLRVCGKEKVSMWLSIATQAFNIVLDVILIVFLGQGVWAADFTSCLAMALGSVITLLMFRKKRMDLYYVKGKIQSTIFFRILANGSSEFFSSISMSVMSIVFNFFLLKYGGTTGVAAFSVIMYVDSIAGMLLFGMADAQQPAISYCYGAGQMNKVKSLFRCVILGGISLSAIALVFMLFVGQYVAPLFVKPEDTELLAVSIIGMKLFSLSYLTGWVDMCFSSYFTALERPARSMLVSLFGTLIFPISALCIMAPLLQLNGVWLSVLVSCTLSAIFTLILYITMRKNFKLKSFQ